MKESTIVLEKVIMKNNIFRVNIIKKYKINADIQNICLPLWVASLKILVKYSRIV